MIPNITPRRRPLIHRAHPVPGTGFSGAVARTGFSGAVAGAATPGTAARRTATGSRRGAGTAPWASAWPQSRNEQGTEPSNAGWSGVKAEPTPDRGKVKGRVIRCRFIISGKNDDLTPDFLGTGFPGQTEAPRRSVRRAGRAGPRSVPARPGRLPPAARAAAVANRGFARFPGH